MTLNQLEDEAKKRKERLLQWKTKKQIQINKRKDYEDDEDQQNEHQQQNQDEEKEEEDNSTKQIEFPKPIFRNYKPRDSGPLSGAIVLPKPKLIDVKSLIDEQLKENSTDKENSSMKTLSEDVDLLTLAPRKPDSDLKRDVEKKFKRLEKRTTRAIAELTRERLLKGQNQSENSLAEVVATTSKLNQVDDDDD